MPRFFRKESAADASPVIGTKVAEAGNFRRQPWLEQAHLAWVRAPVVANRFPATEAVAGVCTHKDGLDALKSHSKLLL